MVPVLLLAPVAHLKRKVNVLMLRLPSLFSTPAWSGHVKRNCVDLPVRRCYTLTIIEVRRDRDRPKKNMRELIR